MVKVSSSLNSFNLKLFKEEPSLSPDNPVSIAIPDDHALASLQLLQMELSVCVQSNQEVELQASLKDVALCDEQVSQQEKKTGNRVIQHYTSNPISAYTGKLDTPIVKFSYHLREEQHIVILKTENILVLSDIEFLSTLSNYFQAILSKKEPEPLEDVSVEDSVSSGASSEYGEPVAKPARPLPKLKMEASVKNIRVAIVEDAEEPQALTLKLSTAYFHVQLTDKNKQASVNIADLSIAASSFFNLDQISKWILLPCSMQLTMTGPIDQPAMDINGTIEPITLTLSPSVIRLVIHAVTSLLPKKDTQNQLPPSDLWDKKKIEDQRFWFLRRVPLHRGRAETITPTLEKGEIMSLGIESVEVILESESTQRSRGYPVLAFNVNAVAQVFEWTGDLTVKADVHCEASYYNEQLSVWEPLLEPLEGKTGRLSPWCITAEVKKSSPEKLVVNGDENGTLDANFSVSLFAEAPLQLTLTKTSLELLKGLAKAYSKEYERKVESSADVHTLTGAPFIIVNKLGGTVGVFVQPGPSLKLRGKAEFAKIISEESVNLWFTKELGRRSYASLITRPGEEEHTVNLAVGIFKKLDAVVISSPGSYYYELEPKKPPTKPVRYGLVVDVAVTGNKKTVTIRSSVQFHNHLLVDIELHSALPLSRNKKERTAIIKPDESYAVPVEMAHSYEFYVVPAGFTLEPIGPPIAWFEKPGGRYADSRCKLPGDIEPCHFIRVLYEEETYKITKHLPTEDFAHHVFHLHPPLLLQNLLPFPVSVKDPCTMRIIEPGEFVHFHEISQDLEPEISISVTQPGENSLVGTLKLVKKPKQYSTFSASANGKSATVSVLTDDFGYHKVSIFSPFWMINKTGLNIEYLVDGKAIKHPSNKNIVLLSTSNPKNNIQVSAITPQGKHTDWTMRFSLNAVGTSGNFIARLGQQCYIFGVEVHLSQFTLTKIATISPYYMLVNETEIFLQVAEATTPSNRTSVPPGELVPFWPLTDDSRMVVTAGTDEKRTAFNYKKPDTVCLKFDNELKAVCVDIQESESAIITTFTPYYPGCVPVQIVNHFPDVSLQFWQDIKSPLVHTLDPGETVLYTWDNPLGRRVLRWSLVGARVKEAKPIYVTKDGQQTLQVRPGLGNSSSSFLVPAPTLTTPPPPSGFADSWLDVDESFSERLVTAEEEGSDTSGTSSFSPSPSLTPRGSLTGNIAGDSKASGLGNTTYKAYWKSFISGIQRVVLFTPHVETIDRVKASATYSQPQLELSLSLRAVGLSLVDNRNKRELAYIAAIQSGVIWQVKKSRKLWKTLNNSVIAMLEEAYQKQEIDVKVKNLVVNLATMEMFSPVKGKLRRTHHDGVYAKFTMSERDYSINAKVAYVQVDNQLPFSVYPQVLYPLPPPPTVASDTEPKPFVEASIILRKKDEQSNVQHFKYVHVLVQKMAVNADLGFLLAVVNFFSSGEPDPQLEAEYVKSDIDDSRKSLKDTIVPAIAKDLESTKSFFDVLHIAPIKIVLSFTVRSVGKNKEGEDTVGDRVLELFLHSLGAILTSVQDTEMKFSLFHLEYQMKTGRALMRTLVKHYRTQALVELYTLVLGLDVLGNPVSIVRGVVGGTIDLFYEPIKGSVLGPEEFFEGLGIGLRSFFGGTVGGITGAGAKITGAVGDVFAKLSFDEQFIDKRQQEKTRPPKMGLKLGGFAKNVFEGVTGVVTQPVKGAKKEGVAGFFKGTGKGLVGLLVRPTGGIIDLTSGTLDFVTRKTQIGNVEIQDIRPPRFIGRDGVVRPYSPNKAVGTALLHAVDEGKYVNQFYFGRVELTKKLIVLVLDRSMMLIEKKLLLEGWHSQGCIRFKHFSSPATVEDTNVILHYKPGEEKGLTNFSVRSRDLAHEVADVINQSYKIYQTEH